MNQLQQRERALTTEYLRYETIIEDLIGFDEWRKWERVNIGRGDIPVTILEKVQSFYADLVGECDCTLDQTCQICATRAREVFNDYL